MAKSPSQQTVSEENRQKDAVARNSGQPVAQCGKCDISSLYSPRSACQSSGNSERGLLGGQFQNTL